MIIVDMEQGSEAWIKEKLGKPSASNASKIITTKGKPSEQRMGYMYELAAEIITGESEDGYKNATMTMGNEREDESRKFYEIINCLEVQKVGVVYKDNAKKFLCSPDGIVINQPQKSHGIELKNVLGKTQVSRLLEGCLPAEYFSQIQFSLYVTGFEFWRFMSYRPKMKPLIITVPRDEKFIQSLAIELEVFCQSLEEIVNKIK